MAGRNPATRRDRRGQAPVPTRDTAYYDDDLRVSARHPAMGRAPTGFGSAESAQEMLDAHRRFISTAPSLDRQRGASGVRGDDWDVITVDVDNYQIPPNTTVPGGRWAFRFSANRTSDPQTIFTPRALSAVRRVRVLPTFFPLLPAAHIPTGRTMRNEFGLRIEELADRATGPHDREVHFRGHLAVNDFLHTASLAGSSAVLNPWILNRSAGAEIQWYNPEIVFQPPVYLDKLTLSMFRSDALLTWPPCRLEVTLTYTNGSTDLAIERTDGAAHELEDFITIVIESAVALGAATLPAGEITISTGGGDTITSTVVTLAGELNTDPLASGSVTAIILVPARRFHVTFEFESARLERSH